jgi:hypothetical protein
MGHKKSKAQTHREMLAEVFKEMAKPLWAASALEKLELFRIRGSTDGVAKKRRPIKID